MYPLQKSVVLIACVADWWTFQTISRDSIPGRQPIEKVSYKPSYMEQEEEEAVDFSDDHGAGLDTSRI